MCSKQSYTSVSTLGAIDQYSACLLNQTSIFKVAHIGKFIVIDLFQNMYERDDSQFKDNTDSIVCNTAEFPLCCLKCLGYEEDQRGLR